MLLYLKTPGPTGPDTFVNIKNWEYHDAMDYVKDQILHRAAASLAFPGIAICLLIGFLLWRLIRASCICCCNKCHGTSSPKQALLGTAMRWIKTLGAFIACCILAASVFAIVQNNDNTVKDGWNVAAQLKTYSGEVLQALGELLNNIKLARASLASSTNTVLPYVPASDRSKLQQYSQGAIDVMTEAINGLTSGTVSFRTETYDRIASAQNDWEQDSVNAYSTAQKAAKGLFGASILFMLLIVVFGAINCPWGAGIAGTLMAALAILHFALSSAVAAGLLSLSDTCSNSHTIVVNLAPTQYKSLVSMYISGARSSLGEEFYWQQAGIANASQIRYITNGKLGEISAALAAATSIVPAAYKPLIRGEQAKIDQMISTITANLGTLSPASGLLGKMSYTSVHPLYDISKAYVCCTLPDMLSEMWVMLTVVGWLDMALCAVVIALLAQLDKLPRSGACCPCAPMLESRLTPQPVLAPEMQHGHWAAETLPPPIFYTTAMAKQQEVANQQPMERRDGEPQQDQQAAQQAQPVSYFPFAEMYAVAPVATAPAASATAYSITTHSMQPSPHAQLYAGMTPRSPHLSQQQHSAAGTPQGRSPFAEATAPMQFPPSPVHPDTGYPVVLPAAAAVTIDISGAQGQAARDV